MVSFRLEAIRVGRASWRRYRPGMDLALSRDDIVIVSAGRVPRSQARAMAVTLDRTGAPLVCAPVTDRASPRRVIAAGYELGHDGEAPQWIPLMAGEALRRGWAQSITTAARPSGDVFAVRAGELESVVDATDGSDTAVLRELESRGPWSVAWAASRPGDETRTGGDDFEQVVARREEGSGDVHSAVPPGPCSPGTPALPPGAVWVGERPWNTFPGLDEHRLPATVTVRHAATDWGVAERWGDHHFATALSTAFARREIGARVVPRHAWGHPFAARELVITLRGLIPARPVLGRVNVLWVISHPEDLQPDEFVGYDLVAVASEPDRDRVASMATAPVVTIFQATDASQYREPGEGDGSVVFVGNTRGERRRSVEWALQHGIRVEVYGQGWEGLFGDEVDVFGSIDRSAAADRFNAASVVLGDHWDDMRRMGYVSNRVFDVAAAGGLLVSDRVTAVDELLPGQQTYETPDELARLVDHWLNAGPDERRVQITSVQRSVLDHHTFDSRLETLLEGLREHLPGGSELVGSLVRP